MSIVTGVLLICRTGDDNVLRGVVEILRQRTESAGTDRHIELHVDDGDTFIGGGGLQKHPQLHIAGSGVNYFSTYKEQFVLDVLSAPWQQPWGVVLILQPEDGVTEVFRPEFRPEDVW